MSITKDTLVDALRLRYDSYSAETVFELAAQEGLPAREERLTAYDLYNADEVFYCTTAGGIMPIVEVDRRQIGDGAPGPLTERLRRAYWIAHVSGADATPVALSVGVAG